MIIIEIAGHLGAEPETRFTASGQKVTNLRVAVNVRKGGKDETIWWRVTMWGDRFDKLLPHLKKGSGVIIVGEMIQKPEIYNDRENRPQVSLEMTAEIVRFSPFGKTERPGQDQQPNAQRQAPNMMGGHSTSSAPFSGVQESPFGSFAGHVAAGQGSHGEMEDNDMPF
jgi:single-strand DNA-binding protein